MFALFLSNFILIYFFMQQSQEQEWIVVTNNKQKHKGKINNKVLHNKSNQKTYVEELKQEYKQKFTSHLAFNQNKKNLTTVLLSLQSQLAHSNAGFHVECLGLGNFLDSKKSYYQLLFLTKLILPLINQICAQQKKQQRQVRVSLNLYDPAFSQKQKKIINQLKATQNQEFSFEANALNLFFMPHCQRFLYQNVLKKYKQLKKTKQGQQIRLVIVGNSIKQYIQRCELLKQQIPQIFLGKQLKQERLQDFQDAFNDTFLLY